VPGLISISKEGHFLPRVGIKCRAFTASGEYVIYTTGYSFSDNFVTFSEINETKSTLTQYSLTKIDEVSTSLTIDLYRHGKVNALWLKLTRARTLEMKFEKSLNALASLVQTLHLPALDEAPV
jgi:hypothetical protein